ncbi:MAG: RIO1 family regulatory kinase/ATPase [Capsulimonadales bacterium]|nr:RIO1 family regulatory kinase/ATPase [Capsulimonadales bacterium]
MSEPWNPLDSLHPFFTNETLIEVLYLVKSGKEATVFCCRGGAKIGGGLVAAKIYRPREHRRFKNDAIYRQARLTGNSREARAARSKSGFGREVLFGEWVGHEMAALRTFHDAGIPVPKPLTSTDTALLMEFLGDEETAAPPLIQTRLRLHDAVRHYRRMLNVIEAMLNVRHVHGDLSAYNLLYWREQVFVIDVPQTVHPWENPDALDLLIRDVTNVADYFADQGVRTGDPERIAHGMWHRYRYERATY